MRDPALKPDYGVVARTRRLRRVRVLRALDTLGGRASLREIAHAANLSVPSTGQILARLEREGVAQVVPGKRWMHGSTPVYARRPQG